ncbi:MAG: 3-oxoacyl-[acyl-carrier-protein] reductase [Candidatus Stahlbacteria bacterium]|nr:3-oxoacyl-[acyl-carrier-protein] reductase [Candidatus Stahlbacteria bacterium]
MKVAVVTGGSKGIGLAIAQKLISDGIKVIIWDVIEPIVPDIEFRKVNIASFNEVKESANKIGDIDILVNNAGITRDKLLMRMKEEDWDSVIAVNLKGTFNCTHAFLPGMIKKRYGRIVNISSVIGIIGNAGQSNYAASKAGIIGFTKSIAKEVGSRNITCNAIAPGFILTEMTQNLSPQIKESYIKSIPLARAGTPEDIANTVQFLISDEASYITGQVINLDGGMVM